jgi:ABC-type antimicrobial peptide transport system permease subunit
MPGMAELAMAGAPIAGGALLGLAAGNLRAPDMRALIRQDMELLEKIPLDEVERRADLQRVINLRIDDLIAAVDKNREIRELATSYQGNWRDIVVFVCTVLFAIIWWNVSHTRSNWLLMFIVMIVLSLIAGVYAARGILRAFATYAQSRRRGAGTGGEQTQ